MNRGIFRILMFVLLLCSCATPTQVDTNLVGETQPPAQPGAASSSSGVAKAIGTIQLVHKSILHNDNEVAKIDDMFENDALYIQGGGEGILELVDKLRMRIFNTTRLGGITIKEAPGTPLSIRMFLERGGFTGQFAALEGETSYETPGGAVIRIRGTQFFVVYNPDSGVTTAGNFGGSVTIESGGSGPLEISSGTMRQAGSGEPPGPEIPLPFTQEQYEGRARDLQDPVRALDSLNPMVNQPQDEVQPPAPPLVETPPTLPPTDTPSPTLTPTLGPPTAEVLVGSHCRFGPSKGFELVRDFNAGVRVPVDGRLADSSWWRVKVPDSRKSCWIYVEQIALSGDLDSVPVLASPPTYTPTPSDTAGPMFESVYADPDPLYYGYECPSVPATTQLYVYVSDPSGVSGVYAEWNLGSEHGSRNLEQVDDVTFTGTIGPVSGYGDLQIQIVAWDNFENYGDTWISIQVGSCIG
jgi:hypothetical protein